MKKQIECNGCIVPYGCMLTYSGIVVDLLNPHPDMIILDDIAQGLSHTSRWNGQCNYYSIAEHSIRVAERTEDYNESLAAMFHDCEEAFWGDIIRPVKYLLKEIHPEFIEKMELLRNMIYNKFNIPDINVKHLDWEEQMWDVDNLIKKHEFVGMQPKEAKSMWLLKLKLMGFNTEKWSM